MTKLFSIQTPKLKYEYINLFHYMNLNISLFYYKRIWIMTWKIMFQSTNTYNVILVLVKIFTKPIQETYIFASRYNSTTLPFWIQYEYRIVNVFICHSIE